MCPWTSVEKYANGTSNDWVIFVFRAQVKYNGVGGQFLYRGSAFCVYNERFCYYVSSTYILLFSDNNIYNKADLCQVFAYICKVRLIFKKFCVCFFFCLRECFANYFLADVSGWMMTCLSQTNLDWRTYRNLLLYQKY